MANTLTGLIPTIYESLDVISREQVGFLKACSRDAMAEHAALGQTITVPIAPEPILQDNTPAVTAPNNGDQVIGSVSMMITKSKSAPFRYNGEEQRGLINAGTYASLLRDQFVQAFRVLGNAIELDLFNEAYQSASRATGTPGTAPFGTAANLSDAANIRRILDDNGAPSGDLHLVLGSAAVANLRGVQTILLKANENGGGADFRKTGNISEQPLDGFYLHNSAAVQRITAGTGAGYVTSGVTAQGVDNVALVSGSGTVNAGDVVTFAADGNDKYVVNTGIAAPGTIQLGNPGAMVSIPSGNALTVGPAYTPNVAFARSALYLLARQPAMPVGLDGKAMDMADDMMAVTDPYTGITYQVAVYRQYRQVHIEVGLAWGVSAIKPEHIALLQG